MPAVYWNPVAINSLVNMILLFTISVFFGWRLGKSIKAQTLIRHNTLLLGTTLWMLLCTLFLFLSHALAADYVDYALPWVTSAGSLSMASFVLFSFYFLEQPALGKWWARLLVFTLITIFCVETYIAIARWQLLAHGQVEYRAYWTSLPSPFVFLLAQLFFFIHFFKAIALDKNLPFYQALQQTLLAIFWPQKKISFKAQSARAFLYFSCIPVVLGLIMLARTYGLIDWRLAEILSTWIWLGILTCLVFVYLNYVPDRTSFRVKLVGLTLVTVLAILNGISWLIGPVYSDAYVNSKTIASHSAIQFKPSAHGSYHVNQTHYAFDHELGTRLDSASKPLRLPFNFQFFGQSYSQLFANQAGMVGFEELPKWRNVQHQYGQQAAIYLLSTALAADNQSHPGFNSGLFIKKEPNRVTLTWHQLTARFSPNDHYTFQLKLYASGLVEMVFAEIPQDPMYDFYQSTAAPMMTGIVPPAHGRKVSHIQFINDLPITLSANEGVIENTRTPFREYLNKVYEPVAYFILIASLLVVIIFPYFFTVNLDRPLRQLIKGVQDILNGRLKTNIKVFYDDEVGYLASSFNEMAASQNELIQTLEDKVAKRTAEASKLAAENARLEERNHLSRELHDTVSQTLFSSNLLAEKIPELTQEDPKRALQALTEIQALNRNALLEMRHLLLSLNPDKIAGYHFGKLLQDAAHEIEQKFSCAIKVNIDNDVILPIDIQLTFYRIAQECLSNAAKYAGTKQLTVYFDGVASQAMLTVSDQGQGFDPKSVPSGHLGLKIMRERMQDIGGSLEVLSQPGKGTTVTAIWIQEDASTNH